MNREMMGQVLAELIPGDSTEIDEATLGMLFPPGEAACVIDERTRTAATRFARDHGCRFLFDGQSSKSTFLKARLNVAQSGARPTTRQLSEQHELPTFSALGSTAGSMARIDRPSLHGLRQGNARHRKLPN